MSLTVTRSEELALERNHSGDGTVGSCVTVMTQVTTVVSTLSQRPVWSVYAASLARP